MTGLRQPDAGRAKQCHWCVMLHKKIAASSRTRVASDAEALGRQQSAQVRASNRFFLAADEFRNLECGQQPISQAASRSRNVAARQSLARISIRCVSMYLVMMAPPCAAGFVGFTIAAG